MVLITDLGIPVILILAVLIATWVVYKRAHGKTGKEKSWIFIQLFLFSVMILTAFLYLIFVAIIAGIPGYILPTNIQAGLELFGFAAFLLTFGIAEFEKITTHLRGSRPG